MSTCYMTDSDADFIHLCITVIASKHQPESVVALLHSLALVICTSQRTRPKIPEPARSRTYV